MYNFMGLNSTAVAIQPNVSCTCNCKRSLFQSMEISKYRPAAPGEGAGGARAAGVPGKFPRGLPGPFGCDALSRSAFPSLSVRAPLSHLLPLGCRCGCDTGRAGGAARDQPLRSPLFPIASPSPSRPFPAMPRRPCPAPLPPAGVMLAGPRASSAALGKSPSPPYRGDAAVRTPE